jgi:hypothetical protein
VAARAASTAARTRMRGHSPARERPGAPPYALQAPCCITMTCDKTRRGMSLGGALSSGSISSAGVVAGSSAATVDGSASPPAALHCAVGDAADDEAAAAAHEVQVGSSTRCLAASALRRAGCSTCILSARQLKSVCHQSCHDLLPRHAMRMMSFPSRVIRMSITAFSMPTPVSIHSMSVAS